MRPSPLQTASASKTSSLGWANCCQRRERHIEIVTEGGTWGKFDSRRLERAFFNLLLNACEAARDGSVGVVISQNNGIFECRVWDTGSGIPQTIRGKLFEPFVSAGKNNGTGLGLAIVSKTVLDHEGEISVERTSTAGTTFLLRIPRTECQTVTTEMSA